MIIWPPKMDRVPSGEKSGARQVKGKEKSQYENTLGGSEADRRRKKKKKRNGMCHKADQHLSRVEKNSFQPNTKLTAGKQCRFSHTEIYFGAKVRISVNIVLFPCVKVVGRFI